MRTLASSLTLITALAACSMLPTAPSPTAKSQLAPTGTLRIGAAVSPNAGTSFVVLDAAKQPHGPPLTMGQELAKAAGVPSSVKLGRNSGELTDWLVAQEIDVAFVPVDEARRQRVDFGPEYFIFESTFLIRPGLNITRIEEVDRPGVRVIGIANTATIRAAGGALKANTIRPVPTVDEAVQAMRSGQADAFAFPRDALAPVTAGLPGSVILKEAYLRTGVAIAIPKGRPEALAFVTRFMEEAKRDGMVRRAFVEAGLGELEVAPASGGR